jgi:radical SAM enzyme (TIGR01210 family)
MRNSREIEQLRPGKNLVNPDIPYHFLHEKEPDANGQLQRVNTIFLTGKECAFKCLMCDLWKNTLDEATPKGAILKQLDYALAKLPQANTIKLYNSSNFFDPKAVPPKDYPGIIEHVKNYKRVIVENHPKLCGDACVEFSRQLHGKLEVAMGLETIHPEVLPLLNKQMTIEDFAAAASFLRSHEIDVRAFVLLNPPYLTGREENIISAVDTIKFAFESGTQCCSIIPTRSGNGVMELLQQEQNYAPPSLGMLEEVFETAISLKKGLVFADTWDIGFLSECDKCFDARKKRLDTMNLDQQIHPKINCNCSHVYA